MAKARRNIADVWEGDFDVSTAQYREVMEVPGGYTLRKGLEVALYEISDRGRPAGFKVVHHFPTIKENVPRGTILEGRGMTEDGAVRNLTMQIIHYYEQLTEKAKISPLRSEERLQKQYLDTLLFRGDEQEVSQKASTAL
jgi:hypothetical protein